MFCLALWKRKNDSKKCLYTMVLMPAMNPALYCCTHYHIICFVIHFFVQITIVQCIICFVIHDLTNLLDSFTIVYVSRKIYIFDIEQT